MGNYYPSWGADLFNVAYKGKDSNTKLAKWHGKSPKPNCLDSHDSIKESRKPN